MERADKKNYGEKRRLEGARKNSTGEHVHMIPLPWHHAVAAWLTEAVRLHPLENM
jgi:hypothetical protein